MVHISLRANSRDWLSWASNSGIHELIIQYIQLRPDHLWAKPPKHEEPFSTPRSWHMFSDALTAYQEKSVTESIVDILASGLLTPAHARQFVAFFKQQSYAYTLNAILKGESKWPEKPEQRDVLYFMVQSFRSQLIKNLPTNPKKAGAEIQELMMRSKKLLIQLSRISLEMAQLVIAEDEQGQTLPDWYMMEISRDLPRLLGD
jgi:hypothetical protein